MGRGIWGELEENRGQRENMKDLETVDRGLERKDE